MTNQTILKCADFITPGITHGFLTRNITGSTHHYCNKDKDLSPISEAEIRLNQNLALATIDAAHKKIQLLCQIHGKEVVVVENPWENGSEPKADGFVTKNPQIILAIMTADCVPILYADPINKVIAAAHSGWKSTQLGIGAEVIDKMLALGAKRDQIQAVIGPCIQMNSYEVGPEFFESFILKDNSAIQFFKPSNKIDHHLFDLPGYVVTQLSQQKLAAVHNLAQDTYSQPELFFSYRRSTHQQKKLDGSLLSMIGID